MRVKAPRWIWIFYAVSILAFYIPFSGILLGAFSERQNDSLVFTMKWFAEVFNDPQLLQSLSNSLIVGLSASLISTGIGAAAAIGINKTITWDKVLLEQLSLLSLFLPEIILALSMLTWFFILKFELGLPTVILAHVTFTLSYVIFTVSARLSLFDKSIEEAAQDLGASSWQTLWHVTLPVLKPALVSGFVMSFLISFDDFLITFFVNGSGQDTLPVTLYSAMKFGISPKLNALSVLMLMATIVLVVFFFRKSGIHALLKSDER
jgi:spermidine/putrescine transport system permease protein